MPEAKTAPATAPDLMRGRSTFIAGVMGPTLLAIGLSLALDRSLIGTIAAEVSHETLLILVSGILLLVAGLAIVRLHAVWHGWPVVVTVFGWLMVIGGLVRILAPAALAGATSSILLTLPILPLLSTTVLLLVGAFLTFKAYV